MDEIEKVLPGYNSYAKEIRGRLIKIIIVFVVGFVFGFLLNMPLIDFVLTRYNFAGVHVAITSPGQIVELPIYAGIILGLLFALPLFSYQIFSFIKPALNKKEVSFITRLFPLNILLFICGITLGIVMVQIILALSARYSREFGITNIWDIRKFFSFAIAMVVLNGLVFQFPVVLTALIRLKILKKRFLAEKRKIIYALLVVFVALLPPIDIISDIILTVPLILLFEITILLNRNQE